jgi:hypothetical protein
MIALNKRHFSVRIEFRKGFEGTGFHLLFQGKTNRLQGDSQVVTILLIE